MLGSNFNEKELRKEIIRERRKLVRDVRDIEGYSKSASQFLPQRWKEMERERGKRPFSEMSKSELRKYYRDIKYLQSLKSTNLQGALEVHEQAKDLASKLPEMTEQQKDTFFNIYGKLYEHSQSLLKDYKYEIFSLIDVSNKFGESGADFALITLLDAFDSLMERGKDIYDEEFKDEFVSLIEMLRSLAK